MLLSRYSPVGVVVDETMTVLQSRGRTSLYLEPAPGMASLDLFRMLREGLMAEARSAPAQAKAENVVVIRDGLRITENNAVRQVRVEVIPFKVPPSGARFFRDSTATDQAPPMPAEGPRPPPPTRRWPSSSRSSPPSGTTSSR